MPRSLVPVLLAFLAALSVRAGAAPAATPPNIVVILIDDLGWTDVGCFGSTFYETPHIDALARQGMKFTQAYSACTVCSPTRAALMTGKYPARLHITDWIPGHSRPNAKLRVPDWTMHLPLEEGNIARALKAAGYATASIGKWHLGDEAYYPERQGFDVNIAGTDRGSPPSYFSPYKIATLPDGPKGEYLSDRLTAEAIAFIERNRERPFFLYLPHFAVHNPIQGKPDVVAKYRAKAKPDAPHHNPAYAAVIEGADDSVGAILAKLDELHLSGRTLVIFTSDNGGLIPNTSNVPLRAGKGSAYEGGIRVPLIVKWPGVVAAGSTCPTPVISADFYPTLLAATQTSDLAAHRPDGESLLPLLRQSGSLARTTLFWHYPHYHPGGATPYSAIREGDLKLIEFFEDNRVELYNVAADIGETRDLAATTPDVARRLRARLAAWREEVGAQFPQSNPAYDPAALAPKGNRRERAP